jgi:hypothetical protein
LACNKCLKATQTVHLYCLQGHRCPIPRYRTGMVGGVHGMFSCDARGLQEMHDGKKRCPAPGQVSTSSWQRPGRLSAFRGWQLVFPSFPKTRRWEFTPNRMAFGQLKDGGEGKRCTAAHGRGEAGIRERWDPTSGVDDETARWRRICSFEETDPGSDGRPQRRLGRGRMWENSQRFFKGAGCADGRAKTALETFGRCRDGRVRSGGDIGIA